MTTRNLSGRLDRLQPAASVQMCIYPMEGESETDVLCRAAAVGRPVIVAPLPAKTTEEWLARVDRYLSGRHA